MKSFELNLLGVEELNTPESVNGGSLIGIGLFLLGACVGGLVWDVVGNPKETAEAWKEGRDEVFK